MIGAFYYPWYSDDSWKYQTSIYHNSKQPLLGWYDNVSNTEIFEKHADMCDSNNIDFLSFSYNQKTKFLFPKYLNAAEKYNVKITVHFEILDFFDSNPILYSNINYSHDLIYRTFRNELRFMMEYIYSHKSSLHIDGKPVIMIYVSRRITTEGLNIFNKVRKDIKDIYGLDIFLMGDDLFWKELDWTNNDRRKDFFDLIYCYNHYVHEDYFGNNKYNSNNYVDYVVKNLYENNFHEKNVPTIIPRYDDTGVRPEMRHYKISNIDLNYFLDNVKKYYDSSGMLLITSFNEWFENTQIEPFDNDDSINIVKKWTDKNKPNKKLKITFNKPIRNVFEYNKLTTTPKKLFSLPSNPPPLQIGAFYYIWYFQNWLNKCARTKLSEKQIPTLGEYNSLDREVISSHIDMANEAGIDFFIVCLTKELIEFGAAKRFFEIYDEIVKTKEKYPKLTIQFETLSYFSKNKELSESDFSKLKDIFKDIEKTIYNDRIWFKYNGKITLFIYVSREIINIESFCQFMKSLFPGVYLFGDEVWYGDCNPKRLSGFDAVYAYNLYLEQDNTDRKTGKEFLKMAHGVIDRFATQSKMVFTKYVPTIMPRYNDTGVRPDVDHYVIPEDDGNLLKEYYHMVEPYVGDLLLVTSFNEWYEDTQIEPLGTADQYGQTCDEPHSITNGHPHKSYYKDYLKIIKDFKEGNIDKTYSIGEDIVLSISQNSENTFEDLVRNSFNV